MEAGAKARASPRTWHLLDWMIHILPASRSAPHLRDASFTTILERTLYESFDEDVGLHPSTSSDDEHMRDAAGPSDTVQDGAKPSRKRKRGTAATSPSKRVTRTQTDPGELFNAVRVVLISITGLAAASSKSQDTTHIELMKMVLRTESAQASRILKCWLVAVRKLLVANGTVASQQKSAGSMLDLSLVLEIWELRIIDPTDETASSSEEFTTECLVPTLLLTDALKTAPSSCCRTSDTSTQALEKLLARHLFAPSRAAFSADTSGGSAGSNVTYREATVLTTGLAPLRAKLLEAAQIEDAGEAVPVDLQSLVSAVARLLDLAIRASPSKSPKARNAEKPWIQAVFVAIVECVGCSLKEPPEFVTSKTAAVALESALRVLRSHAVNINPEILGSLFWYHCGVKYPECVEREIHWSLLAALIELDSSMFTTEPKRSSATSKEQTTYLSEFVFGLISNTELKGPGFANEKLVAADEEKHHADKSTKPQVSRVLVLDRILTPMVSAFARNRNLLGFLRRWDDQLVESNKYENRNAMEAIQDPIWEDRALVAALMEHLEQSLTQGQVAKLIQEHADRMNDLTTALATQAEEGANLSKLPAYMKAASSAVIIPAILQSIQSDENVAALKPQLQSLLSSYTTRVLDDRSSTYTRPALSWFTLCQLTSKLWPIELHASSKKQQKLLHPLVEQSTMDMSAGRKESGGRKVDSSARAAAMMFLLDVCDRFQTTPGSEELVQNSVQKILKCLSTLPPEEHTRMTELFCTHYIRLLSNQDSAPVKESLLALLSRLSKFENVIGDRISRCLSQSICMEANAILQDSYSAALSETLAQKDKGRLHGVAVNAFVHVQPSVLSRDKREAILDRLTQTLSNGPSGATGLLSIMVQVMQVPNASATISTKGGVLFDIADQLHECKLESPTTLQQFQLLLQKTLGHIVPNHSQAQNRAFLGEFMKRLNLIVNKINKCSSARLAIMRATLLEQKDTQLLNVKQYVELLKKCLTAEDASGDVASISDILDSFNDIPRSVLQDADLYDSTQTWLQRWIKDNADLDSYLTLSGPCPAHLAGYIARLHAMVSRYQLYPNINWLIDLTLKVVREPIADSVKIATYQSITEVLTPMSGERKLALVPVLTDVQDSINRATSFRILHRLIASMDDKLDNDPKIKQKQFALLPRLCVLLAETSDAICFNALIDGLNTLLNDKSSFASQNGVESVLSVLVKLTSRTSPALPAEHASEIFPRLCETTRLVILVHRSRLGGRFHLLLPLLQGLLFCLFMPASGRSGALPAWLRSTSSTEHIRLTSTNAAQYTRLISTLCNPPPSSLSKSHQNSRKSKDLNDPVKAAREKSSHFLYPLLASLCRFQLAGRLDPAVRAQLMPGIWEAVGTASLHKEGLDAMFAGLTRSERDVWRGVWQEWESVHGRKERVVEGEVQA
jgi:nucleolar pre-ribosomal-associated protein 2